MDRGRRAVVLGSLAGVAAATAAAGPEAAQAADAAALAARGAEGPIKCVILISAKPGVTREAFMDHYEHHHVMLARRLFPTIGDYRRNYMPPAPMGQPNAGGPGFDVVTEMWFATQADYDAFRAESAKPEVAKQVHDDELLFIDRPRTRLYVVQETVSPATYPRGA